MWCSDSEVGLGQCIPGVFPEIPWKPDGLVCSPYLVSVICLDSLPRKLPVVSVYLEDLILLQEDFGWDLETDSLSAAVLFLQLWGRRARTSMFMRGMNIQPGSKSCVMSQHLVVSVSLCRDLPISQCKYVIHRQRQTDSQRLKETLKIYSKPDNYY